MSGWKKREAKKKRERYKKKGKKMTLEAVHSGSAKQIYDTAMNISKYHAKYNHHHLRTLEDAMIETQDAQLIKFFALNIHQSNRQRMLAVARLLGAEVSEEQFEGKRRGLKP